MVRAILNACQEIVAKNPGNYDIAYIPDFNLRPLTGEDVVVFPSHSCSYETRCYLVTETLDAIEYVAEKRMVQLTACLILSYHSKKHLLLLKKEGRMPKDYLA
jgi:hypothetical protein